MSELQNPGADASSRLMLRTAYSLMLNTLVNAALGVGYWIAAARLFSAEIVGRDGALISAMAALSALCGLNMNNTLIRFLPRRRTRAARMVLAAYAAASISVAVGAAVFVLVIPAASDQFSILSDRPGFAAFYALSVVAWGLFGLQDVVLTSIRRAAWVPVENAIYGISKLALLPVLAAVGAREGILIAWVAPMMVLLLPINGLIFGRLLRTHEHAPVEATQPESLARGGRLKFVAQDAFATAIGMASRTLLPLLAVAFVGSRDAAHFYVPFMIISTVDLLFSNATTSLVAEGARGEVALDVLVRTTLRRFMPVLVVATAALIVAAPLVLAVFGPEYAHDGADVLRIMAAASVFRAIMMVGIAVARLRGRAIGSLAIQGGSAALLGLLVAVLAPAFDLRGVAFAWLTSSVIVGLAALPFMLKAGRIPPLRSAPTSLR